MERIYPPADAEGLLLGKVNNFIRRDAKGDSDATPLAFSKKTL
jgi:hypothetical protein